jgi:hypothetical protein
MRAHILDTLFSFQASLSDWGPKRTKVRLERPNVPSIGYINFQALRDYFTHVWISPYTGKKRRVNVEYAVFITFNHGLVFEKSATSEEFPANTSNCPYIGCWGQNSIFKSLRGSRIVHSANHPHHLFGSAVILPPPMPNAEV